MTDSIVSIGQEDGRLDTRTAAIVHMVAQPFDDIVAHAHVPFDTLDARLARSRRRLNHPLQVPPVGGTPARIAMADISSGVVRLG